MEALNFLNHALSTQRSIRQWYRIVLLSSICTLAIIGFTQIRQVIRFLDLKHEYITLLQYKKSHRVPAAQKKKLIEQHRQLKEQCDMLSTFTSLPHHMILLIAQLIPVDCCLTDLSYRLKDQKIILKGEALSSESLTEFVRALSEHDNIPHVTLTSIHHQDKQSRLYYEVHINL
jgi:Tfp pilus assembly protein PilN